MTNLADAGFNLHGIVTDNHTANVAAFKMLHKEFPGDGNHYIIVPVLPSRVYLFFELLLKNIRNNLLNRKKFVFPDFSFQISDLILSSGPGYVSWSDLHRIYEMDQKLPAYLRKAPHLTYKALHPGDKKQNVALVIAIFQDTTIVGCEKYLPDLTGPT